MNIRSTFCIPLLIASLLVSCVAPRETPVAQPAPDVSLKGFESLIFHPGVKSGEPIAVHIVQTSDPSGFLQEYHIDIDSVICGDGQCEIITVRLIWDPLGQFLRYEFPEGGNLTKRGHEQFTQADHEKMQLILEDQDSLLRDVHSGDVVHPGEAQSGDEIDGSSGATLLSDKSAIVSGAVYTCYTLWHWVYSDIPSEIQTITAENISTQQLLDYLDSPEEIQTSFAVRQITIQGIKDDATQAAIYDLALNGSTELASAAIGYFQSLGADDYYQAVGELFQQGSSKKQILYLSSLVSTELKAPKGFYDELSANLTTLGSYYEVHLLLNLMTEYNYDSPIVVSNALPLLDNSSFLIGRRAYNFLKDMDLSESQTEKVQAFKTKYADRL